MQGVVIGGICLLAFLLSKGRAEEPESLNDSKLSKDVGDLKEVVETVGLKEPSGAESSDDLKTEISLAVTETYSQDKDDRPGPISHSSIRSFGGLTVPYPQAPALAGGSQVLPSNSYNADQTISDSGSPYSQGLTSFPYASSFPYSSGSSSVHVRDEADNESYKPPSVSTPVLSPYNQGSNPAQHQAENGFYHSEPGLSPVSNRKEMSPVQALAQADKGLYQRGGSTNLNQFNQASNSVKMQGQGDSESDQPIIRPLSTLPKARSNPTSDSLSAFHTSYPFNQGLISSSASAHTDPKRFQPSPIPDSSLSSFESYLVPYKDRISSISNSHGTNVAGVSSFYPYNLSLHSTQLQAENEPYQPLPIPDQFSATHDSYLVPYKGLSFSQMQNQKDGLSIPIPDPNPALHDSYFSPYRGQNIPQRQSVIEEFPIPSSDPDPASYHSFLVPYKETHTPIQTKSNLNYEHHNERYNSDSTMSKVQLDSEAYQAIPLPDNDPKSSSYLSNIARSGANTGLDDIELNTDLESKSGWEKYEYNPTSSPTPQLYPSGAETAQAHNPDSKMGIGYVNPYSMVISPYIVDYPSESPYRPGSLVPVGNAAQGPPSVYSFGQSLPIAFQDAKSRLIYPHEYVFPNKMPGGENTIQCMKENEFHHFWAQEVDCLVCICLNEYGLLTPVCASCGGCHSPPPKLPIPIPRLPEQFPVQPAQPEPFEPIQVTPEPYPTVILPEPYSQRPQPEPTPSEPVPEPYQPVPTPVPHPGYPEPTPTLPPAPEPIPTIPTMPPPPFEASCNPLPSGQPFTNPLHPCQICICRESYATGKADVQIDCKENPQCIAPADVTALPPLPDVPVPIPLPMCEKFPEHVLFPHPTETCKLCKCTKSVPENGIPEQQITCYPHPDCIPKVEPVTVMPEVPPPLPIPIDPHLEHPYPGPEPVPIEPLREPYPPMAPVPLPEIVTVEPLPWPPITTVAPVSTTIPSLPVLTPRPGPLPGPSPHESCRPYPPNQTFQHPWDECQVCICTEATAVGMITVEVNCYTKPACCIEPPEAVKAAFPGKLLFITSLSTRLLAVKSPDIQTIPGVLQPGGAGTSTYRPQSFSSYTPRPFTGSNQAAGSEGLIKPGYPPVPYTRLQADDAFLNPSANYPYQPNYPGYPQFPDFPPRLPVPPDTMRPYDPNKYGYPSNYQYSQGDTIGSPYPGTQAHFQPYDQRYPGVPPSFPQLYSRANYAMPPIYPPGQPPPGGSNAPNPPNYGVMKAKTGKDGANDDEKQ